MAQIHARDQVGRTERMSVTQEASVKTGATAAASFKPTGKGRSRPEKKAQVRRGRQVGSKVALMWRIDYLKVPSSLMIHKTDPVFPEQSFITSFKFLKITSAPSPSFKNPQIYFRSLTTGHKMSPISLEGPFSVYATCKLQVSTSLRLCTSITQHGEGPASR